MQGRQDDPYGRQEPKACLLAPEGDPVTGALALAEPGPTLHIGLPTSVATRESLAPSPAFDHREDLGAGFDAVPVLLCTVRSSAASTNNPVYTVHDRTKEAVNAPAGARRKDRDRRHGRESGSRTGFTSWGEGLHGGRGSIGRCLGTNGVSRVQREPECDASDSGARTCGHA